MIAVKLLKEYEDTYEPGHVVDLPDDLANKLINKGIAKEFAASQTLPVTVVAGGAE